MCRKETPTGGKRQKKHPHYRWVKFREEMRKSFQQQRMHCENCRKKTQQRMRPKWIIQLVLRDRKKKTHTIESLRKTLGEPRDIPTLLGGAGEWGGGGGRYE